MRPSTVPDDTSRGTVAPRVPRVRLDWPRLAATDGALEALKWIGLALMTMDHINKYLLGGQAQALYSVGRLAMPIFAFVLAYNLSRTDAIDTGVYRRVAMRLAATGMIACLPVFAFGGLGWGWWPLNIMFTLLGATGVIWALQHRSWHRFVLALLILLPMGALSEFWWPGIAVCVAAWAYCRKQSPARLALWALTLIASASLTEWMGAISAHRPWSLNLWPLASLGLIFLVTPMRPHVPRVRHVFYAYYPAHLAVLWAITKAST